MIRNCGVLLEESGGDAVLLVKVGGLKSRILEGGVIVVLFNSDAAVELALGQFVFFKCKVLLTPSMAQIV